jgi:hypothetical protein
MCVESLVLLVVAAENATTIELPSDFGRSILVIDALCAGCGGRQCPVC